GTQNLEKYKRLGVKEVWFWIDNSLEIYILIDNLYKRNNYSFNLPKLEDKLLTKYIAQSLNSNPRTLEKSFLEELQ
ncbi:MAG: Uma2 family endonuclease, partial [Pleurocapsa sp.]